MIQIHVTMIDTIYICNVAEKYIQILKINFISFSIIWPGPTGKSVYYVSQNPYKICIRSLRISNFLVVGWSIMYFMEYKIISYAIEIWLNFREGFKELELLKNTFISKVITYLLLGRNTLQSIIKMYAWKFNTFFFWQHKKEHLWSTLPIEKEKYFFTNWPPKKALMDELQIRQQFLI